MFQKDPGLLSSACRLVVPLVLGGRHSGLPTISSADGHSPSTPLEKTDEIFDC